eukprot:scaffold8347_cov62-Phaeocystis_antarctica.AAC.4
MQALKGEQAHAQLAVGGEIPQGEGPTVGRRRQPWRWWWRRRRRRRAGGGGGGGSSSGGGGGSGAGGGGGARCGPRGESHERESNLLLLLKAPPDVSVVEHGATVQVLVRTHHLEAHAAQRRRAVCHRRPQREPSELVVALLEEVGHRLRGRRHKALGDVSATPSVGRGRGRWVAATRPVLPRSPHATVGAPPAWHDGSR